MVGVHRLAATISSVICFSVAATCPFDSRSYLFLPKKEAPKDFFFLVRIKGVEPPRRRHRLLRPARLPIPPYPHSLVRFERFVFRSPFRVIFPTTSSYYHTPHKMSTFLKALGTAFFVEAKKNVSFHRGLRHLPRGSRTNKQCRKIWNGTRGVLRPKAKNFLNSMNKKPR